MKFIKVHVIVYVIYLNYVRYTILIRLSNLWDYFNGIFDSCFIYSEAKIVLENQYSFAVNLWECRQNLKVIEAVNYLDLLFGLYEGRYRSMDCHSTGVELCQNHSFNWYMHILYRSYLGHRQRTLSKLITLDILESK
jgi:hypothetical protein